METIIFFYTIWSIGIFLGTLGDIEDVACTPRQIYDSNDLNMFGCVVVFLVFLVLDPLFFALKFLMWVFTVGRKD
jgi:hypothetical protein